MGQAESEKIQLEAQVDQQYAGKRLDQVAAAVFSDYSRARLQEWIKAGQLTVNGRSAKPKDKLVGTESLQLQAELKQEVEDVPEKIDLDIIFEDDHLLVINKPAGLVVHPAAGHASGTLLNGLLHHCPGLQNLPRAGIVHRLDRDTTGLMVVAKTLESHHSLVDQLQDKSVFREYDAVTVGVMTGGGTVDAPLGRHPTDRKRQAVIETGKDAVTHYRLHKRYRGHTHIRVQLETGRTHQIRVHMAHVRYPLVGDPVYGGRPRLPKGGTQQLRDAVQRFPRQALHARRLGLIHPVTDEEVIFESPLPADFQGLLMVLEQDMASDA